jgi:hypothetical protein
MSGMTELGTLLATIAPELDETEMVFCSFAAAEVNDEMFRSATGFFKEREGITLIVARADAERHGVAFGTVMKMITLTVHSSLEAVGLTAAVTSRLARHGISANVVAAYYHDHVFVPVPDAERALQVLQALQEEAMEGRYDPAGFANHVGN